MSLVSGRWSQVRIWLNDLKNIEKRRQFSKYSEKCVTVLIRKINKDSNNIIARNILSLMLLRNNVVTIVSLSLFSLECLVYGLMRL